MNKKYIALLTILVTLSKPISTSSSSLPLNSTQIITSTKNHILNMVYYIQPKITVDIPVTLTFSDVPKGIWYETASKYVVSQEIMAGTSETTFSPNKTITRGLVATIFANANRANLGIYPNVFHDASDQWYRDAVNWCAKNKIMVGYEDNRFGGDDPVTREQLALVLFQYEKFVGGNTTATNDLALSQYADHQDASFYGRESLAWCVNRGLLLGTDNHINPHQAATRAEVAFAVYRLLENT